MDVAKLNFITVAPYNCNEQTKSSVDWLCTGENDELTIQNAIDQCVLERKNLYFLNGIYHIDGFYDFGDGGPKTAICFPNARREITVLGQNYPVDKNGEGVIFHVTAKALEDLTICSAEDSNANDPSLNPVDVIRTTWTQYGLGSGASLRMENIKFNLSHNQKSIRCLDLRRCDRVELKNIGFNGYAEMEAGLGKPPAVPVSGCIGLTTTDGSNHSYSNYTNVGASGFYEGIQVSGEHVVLINCSAIMCYYGFTFGNYGISCGANHPITLINCMDERNVHLPLFNQCGDSDKQGNRILGEQEVSMISFNIERIAVQTPGGKLGDLMREVVPGTWRGNIDFTAQPAWNHVNEKNFQLWENDGSGKGFKTRNVCHKIVGTTEERMSYYPTYGQQMFDTDLNKMLICIDPAQKKWVDCNGKEV